MSLEQSVLARERFFGRLVMIYQMPKIGSQTIEATLRQAAFPHPIYRFHSLSPEIAKTIQHGVSSTHPAEAWKRDARQQLESSRSIRNCIRVRRVLRLCGFRVPKLEIITGVRELIGLMLASIFENYRYFEPTFESMTVEKCREALLHPKTFKTIQDWFDLELKAFAGFDVYRTGFPQALGHCVYITSFARVLVYRFENLDGLPRPLSKFLGWDISQLVSSNLGGSKDYAQQYRYVKDRLRLPSDFVSGLYESKLMRHFYSVSERQNWHAKWSDAEPTRSQSVSFR